jgi:hypothetical protein
MKKSVLVLAAVIVAVAGGSAEAAHLITSSDIQDGTIRGADIHGGTISMSKFSRSVQKAIRAGTKLRVPAAGPIGPAGANGANGADGAKGDKGDKGDTGAPGKDAIVDVKSLSTDPTDTALGTWFVTHGVDATDCGGSSTTPGAVALAAAPGAPAAIGSDAVQFGPFADSAQFGSIYSHALDGVKLKDIDELSFDNFESQAGTDYLRLFLSGTTSGQQDDVIFSPSSQNNQINAEPVNQWVRYNVLAGTVRYDDDADVSGDESWAQLIHDRGNETIAPRTGAGGGLVVSAGCSSPGPNNSASVDHVVVAAGGQETTFDFER